MIPIKNVKNIINTYEALEKDLASHDIDKTEFVKKSKEYSSISEIINEEEAIWAQDISKTQLLAVHNLFHENYAYLLMTYRKFTGW